MNLQTVDLSTLQDRAVWSAFCCLIGYVWGKTSHNSKEIDRMMHKPTKTKRVRDERGSMKMDSTKIFMLVVVVLVAWSSFSSARTSSKVADQNDRLEAVSTCTSTILFKAIDALNQRTQYSGDQATANVNLQKSQLKLLTKAFNPDSNDAEQRQAFLDYLDDLQTYVTSVTQVQSTQNANPYPTPGQYAQCLSEARDKALG